MVQKPVQFLPTLYTSDKNQDFTYITQSGLYMLTGDTCKYDFVLVVGNLSLSQATGDLMFKLPVPYTKVASINPVSFVAQYTTDNIAHVALVSTDNLQAVQTNGVMKTLNMNMLDKSVGILHIRGQLSYFWR